MEKVKINSEKCKGCLLCVSVCPRKCIKPSEKINKAGYKFVVFNDNDKCTSCGFCFLVCPDAAIEVYK
ncbi:MAG TPA: 2-oxoacid:acceptor oxidoreductase [Elusimicrobia bacterium]|nr:2-oxoacid:acceptor oxidoreductase [Elusimicrobiota bacterium]